MRIFILNTGGTLGMVGKPLRPAKLVKELFVDVSVPKGASLTLKNFERIIDSSNMMHKDRVNMAKEIARVYKKYDAFVVLHGTDSMAETAAALSMIFQDSLQKPIFIIGAQYTKDESGSEVKLQLENTLRVSAIFHHNGIRGVFNICMGDVLDGSRLSKRKDSDYSAFYTPGRHPVAQAWPYIVLKVDLKKRDSKKLKRGLILRDKFLQKVASINFSADCPPSLLMNIARNNGLDGVIIVGKGAGNISDVDWDFGKEKYSWIDAIKECTKKGVIIGILSPFEDGRVNLDRYELGVKAKNAGAISLESLTPAMADFKFRQAIAMFGKDRKKIQKYISTDFVGELLPLIEQK